MMTEMNRISGSIECAFGNGKDEPVKLKLEPEIQYQSPTEWLGDIRWTSSFGDMTQADALVKISVKPGADLTFKDDGKEIRVTEGTAETQATILQDLERNLAAAIICPILTIPEEDLLFISDELNTEAWQSIRQTANPLSEGGIYP